MSENPAPEQDVRTCWYRVEQGHLTGEAQGWSLLAEGEARFRDAATLAIDLGEKWRSKGAFPVRVRVWDNAEFTGDPVAERFSPDEGVPWRVPPAEMADPTPEPEQLPQRTPEDVPPPLNPQPAEEPTIDTLEKLLAHLRDTVTAPGYDPALGYHSPLLNIDVDQLPDGFPDMLKEAFERYTRRKPTLSHQDAEDLMLRAGTKLNNTLYRVHSEAERRGNDRKWVHYEDLINTIAVECQTYMGAWTLWKLEF